MRDWLEVWGAWWLLFGFDLALRVFPLEQLEQFTGSARDKKNVTPDTLAWARRRRELIYMAARSHRLPMTCLPQALTLGWRLKRSGIPAQLRIGTNKSSTGIHMHAWVDVDGVAIGEPEDITARFSLLVPVEH